jgi:hypothetical protein
MTLHEDQLAVIEAMKSRKFGNLLAMIGGAGTGKSFVINEIKEQIGNVLLACPTGQAASIIGGSTIHSLFGIPTGDVINPNFHDVSVHKQRWKDKTTRFFGGKRAEILQVANWIVLDEYGMIRCDHLDFIDYALRWARKEPHEPFGGVGILLSGDDGQLGAVVTGQGPNRSVMLKSDMAKLMKYGYNAPFGANQSRVLNDD